MNESDMKRFIFAKIDDVIKGVNIIKGDIEKSLTLVGLPSSHLENAGILFKNKVITLSNFFESKGLSYFKTVAGNDDQLPIPGVFGFAIMSHLTDLTEQAVNELMAYDRLYGMTSKGTLNKVTGVLSLIFTGSAVSSKKTEQLNEILNRYRAICNQIFNFSLEKDLYNVLVEGSTIVEGSVTSVVLLPYIYRGSYLDTVLHSLGCGHVFEKLMEIYGPHEILEESKKSLPAEILDDENELNSAIKEALSKIRDEEQAKRLENRYNVTCDYCNNESLNTEDRIKLLKSVLSEIEEQLEKEKQKRM